MQEKQKMIEPASQKISISQQCELLGISRSSYYRKPVEPSGEAFAMRQALDKEYTVHPFKGTRRLSDHLQELGYKIGRDGVRTMMREMGICAIYPKPRLSLGNKAHKKYPYLLRKLEITRSDHVWCCDITYIPFQGGHLYLAVIMDWATRFVLGWELSRTMDSGFCVDLLKRCLKKSKPEIFNTDQGSQFTCENFCSELQKAKVKISMDAKGRCFDNIMIERLWRTVKYEEVYLKSYDNFLAAEASLQEYFYFYNYERRHSSLKKQTPWEAYQSRKDPVDHAA